MRRQTTKQPSGAATIAKPRPASKARSRKGSGSTSATRSVLAAGAAARMAGQRLAGQIVPMVVLMLIETEGARRLRTEQAGILGMLRHRLRHARAAHMPVEADDAVALR